MYFSTISVIYFRLFEKEFEIVAFVIGAKRHTCKSGILSEILKGVIRKGCNQDGLIHARLGRPGFILEVFILVTPKFYFWR